MLDDALKDAIRDAYQTLTDNLGLKPRLGQRQMIAEVANALGDPELAAPIAVVEAGTGTGKTIAYTVAALPAARARGKHLVIATATVALQSQLIDKDLPDIQRHSGLTFSVQLAKGRGRYVCLHKLDQQLAGRGQAPALIPLYPDEVAALDVDAAVPQFEAMLDALASRDWDGDLDHWPASLDPQVRRAVTTDAVQCLGRHCPHIANCSFFAARDGLAEAEVIVTNHDLVLSDLKLGGGAILPPPEDCLYVFDEGHQLPDKCLNQFTRIARIGSTQQALRDSAGWLARDAHLIADHADGGTLVPALDAALVDLDQLLGEVGDTVFDLLEALPAPASEYRFPLGIAPDDLVTRAGDLAVRWDTQLGLATRLEAGLERAVEEADVSLRDRLEAALVNATALRARAEGQMALWRAYAEATALDEASPWARWVRHFGSADSVELLASPVLAADLLREHLWSRAAGAVVTSATLAALGNFDRFRERAGVPADSRFKQVVSPFDSQRAVFHVPAMAVEPGDADAHTAEVSARLPALLAGHRGALVLFSSRRQMLAVADAVAKQLDHELLVQDALSKGALLARHRDNVDADRASVIFGLASFAEGIDLPGAYCSHVVIAKLPFAVPDDPREAALAELVERGGGNAFMAISVPDAALKLTQACGRLLRTEADSGQITLLDTRITRRRYGRAILDSLPRYTFRLEG